MKWDRLGAFVIPMACVIFLIVQCCFKYLYEYVI